MAGRLSLAALACVAASVAFVFAPLDLSNETGLAGALALAGLGVVLGVAAVVRREFVFGMATVALGLLLAAYYVALYGHRN